MNNKNHKHEKEFHKNEQQKEEKQNTTNANIDKCENVGEKTENKPDELNYQTNLEAKVLEYLQTAQRLQAEFDNYRKRAQEQITQSRFDGMADAISQFIPALDSFNNAKKLITDPKMLEGFCMIENQILSAFKNLGVKKIETKNQHFDPQLHNALAVQTDNSLDNDIIINEYQAGYKLKDKIIRYSQVIVNKKED